MKPFVLSLACVALWVAGCDSMSSRINDRFTPVPPQTHNYAADRRAVYAAGQVAVKNVGLLLGHTSFSQGRIDAYAPITGGDATRDTRQTTMEIRITEADRGETQVSVLVSEQTEGSFPGGVSAQPLREHSLYGLYFSALQQVLLENVSIKADEKP
jgi:hypothetical protein